MASKNKQAMIEMQVQKLISRHPEIIEQYKSDMVMSHMASALTIALDWMIPRYSCDKEECEAFMEYFMLQLAKIGSNGWDSFFEDVDKLIKEDVGFTPYEYIQAHLKGSEE